MESLPLIVEKKVNILNYTLHFLWKQNLCRCETLSDFWLFLVEETSADLPGLPSSGTGVFQGVPGLSESAPEII